MMTEKISFLFARRGVSVIACFALGVLYALPYLAEQLFVCTYIALIGFFAVLFTGDRLHRIYRHCIAFFFGFYLVLYSFLSSLYPFESFGFTSGQAIFVIIAACLFIPLYHAALHSAVMLLAKPFKKRMTLAVFVIPCAWTLAELVIASGTLAFPWGTVALSQTGFLPMIQTESLLGGYFITLVITGGCSLIAYALADKKRAFAIGGVSVMLLNLAAGCLIYILPDNSDAYITVAAVQGDVRLEEKWQSDKLGEITDRYVQLVVEAADAGAELVVTPESAIPAKYNQYNSLGTLYTELASQNGISIVAGVLLEGSKSNGVVSINADGTEGGRYYKRHPVPFGEYIPYYDALETLMPFLKNFNLSGMTLEAGEDAAVLECGDATVGTLVCFDSIFPSLALDEVREGAEIMTVVTNDSWFKISKGVTQHYRHAKLRAIECGRYYVQAGNTGVSGVIDQKGNVLCQSSVQTKECLVAEAKLLSHRTLYSYIGDLVLYPVAAAVVAALIYNFVKNKKEHHNDSAKQQALSDPVP